MILAIVLILVVVFTQQIQSIPNARLTEIVWQIFTVLMPSPEVKELRTTRDNLIRVRQERSNTSSQDEFAKWARLDREHLALKKKYEQMNADVGHLRQKVGMVVRLIKLLLTTGIKLVVQFYFRRSAVVWIPFTSKFVERILAFPMAPRGSISVGFWLFAVDRTLISAKRVYKGWKSNK